MQWETINYNAIDTCSPHFQLANTNNKQYKMVKGM